MPRLRSWSLGVLGVAVLALAGCSSSPSTSPTSSSTRPTAPPTTVVTAPVQDPSPAGTFGTAPTITVPPGAPPTQLQASDLIVGTGPVVKVGDKVTAQYVLATYSTRQQVQTSWTSSPFSFVLAKGNVIDGWVQGVPGMRVGGRRELIIPPELGFGSQSPGQGIAPNDTLVFI
ncbi:MAG: FKBP-type peptidyl-prolyl cis-trans isomerase, partial [Acidimicrobiales bacterium]